MNPPPIFFAWTRSFWLGWFPAILTFIDVLMSLFGDPALSAPVAGLIVAGLQVVAAPFPIEVSVTAKDVEATMQALSPLYALIVAHQRRGPSRPYTADPRALK